MNQKCKICGLEFETKNNKRMYCSSRCNGLNYKKTHRNKINENNRKYILQETACLYCNKSFIPDRNHPLAKFCSHKCRCAYNWYNKYRKDKIKSPSPHERNTRTCIVCGGLFKPDKLYHPFQKYCSKKCMRSSIDKRYYYSHREKCIKKSIKWAKQNPEKFNDNVRSCHFRRKSKIKDSGIRLTQKQQEEIRKRDKNKCVYCHKEVIFQRKRQNNICLNSRSLDHILPVNKGGLDSVDNIVVCCIPCNTSKQDKLLENWLNSGYCKEKNITLHSINQSVLKLLAKSEKT